MSLFNIVLELNDVKQIIKSKPIHISLEYFLLRPAIRVFPQEKDYRAYIELVRSDFPSASHVLIAGSGNWGYSFNPRKFFKEFNERSDIDLAIVSWEDFHTTWEVLREYHRKSYYMLSRVKKEMLRRNGENVYSGFITPKWIPDIHSPHYLDYYEKKHKYSNDMVGYRDVNLMFFKNQAELFDYYKRSFAMVRKK